MGRDRGLADDNHPVVNAVVDLEQGRESYATCKWVDAYESLAAADQATPLSAGDLELLARSGYMLGRDDDYVSGLERAHHAYLESGEGVARCALRVVDWPQLPVSGGDRAGEGMVRSSAAVARARAA